MAGGSTLALKSGVFFQVLDDGTVSVVDPSNGSTNVAGILPKSAIVSSKVSFKQRYYLERVGIDDVHVISRQIQLQHKLLEIRSAFSLAFQILFEE